MTGLEAVRLPRDRRESTLGTARLLRHRRSLEISMHALLENSRGATLASVAQRSRRPKRWLRLDKQMPDWDVTRIERRVIDATPEKVFDAALNTDFVDAVRHSRGVQVLFAMRAVAERVATAVRRRPPVRAAAATLRVGALPLRGEWVTLGQDWPHEIAFGAIGRFWAGETKWLISDASVFGSFQQPGFAKIACHFAFRRLGDGRTLVTYEARTKATDATSRRAFLRYWHLVSPFVGVVMRSMLATIDRNVVRGRLS